MLIDSHCHLHDREFFSEEQAEEILLRARENGVQKIICIGTDPDDSMRAREFADSHPDVYWTYGIHPEETDCVPEIASLGLRPSGPSPRADGAHPRVAALRRPFYELFSGAHLPIAIGEVGLDYHSDGYDRKAQIRLFEEMLQLAVDNDLPLSFHVRNAFSDFFPIVENFPTVRGCVHSFTDSKKTLKRILENTDFYVGVNGLATYSTLPTPPLERILLETDAPFLTPVPFRGMINESRYIFNIAEWLSQKLGVEFEIIEKVTTENAERLFRFPSSRTTERAE